ncbi:MAG: ABC-F family ATP-binding cassette domain-containing protein [Oscillospiraceae bacterium]
MLITMQNLAKSFGAEIVLTNVNAVIQREDRIGMIGENGAGKTTLLKIICGELQPDSGEISFARDLVLGYLEQNSKLDVKRTVWQEMENAFQPVLDAMQKMKALEKQMENGEDSEEIMEQHSRLSAIIDASDGYTMDSQIKKILNGMAFLSLSYEQNVASLSGGEHTRLCLAKLLLQHPDVLILDEPTNHLDFATMEWLENYLKAYTGAIIVVSHDRYFLDAVCNRIFEMEQGSVQIYRGNYSAYLPQKQAAVDLQQKQHNADVEKVKKLEDYIARNLVRASTTKMAQSRRKVLEKMEVTEKPHVVGANLKFRFEYDIEPYLELVIIKNLSVNIGGKPLLDSLNLTVRRGERLIIAGPNGAGKSTLLRVLAGKLKPSGGMVRIGMGAKTAYFEQQQGRRMGTVQSAIWDKHPKMTDLEVRSHLAKLNFRGEDVLKPCSALSGGELARLRFAELLLERPNLMFLDEPTNHLDIYTRESLGLALAAYEGTLILVTHDRYLMNSLECPILYIEDCKAVLYDGYEAMLRRNDGNATAQAKPSEPSAPKPNYGKEQRRRKAELRTRLKQLEDEIEKLGADIVEIENTLNLPSVVCDHEKVTELCDTLSDTRFHQQELYDEWGTLAEEQEQYEQEE